MEEKLDLNIWKKLTQAPRLGEILIKRKKITILQLGKALDIQKKENIPVGEALIKMGVITMEDLLKALDLQVNIDKMLNQNYHELKRINESRKLDKS